MRLRHILFVAATICLAACGGGGRLEEPAQTISLAELAKPYPYHSDPRHWSWQSEGNFPSRIELSIFNGLSFLSMTGPSMPEGGWKELQQAHHVEFGVLHVVRDRFFLIFSDQPNQVAEIAVTSGNRLAFWWDDPVASNSPQLVDAALAQRPVKSGPPSLELLLRPPPEPGVMTETKLHKP